MDKKLQRALWSIYWSHFQHGTAPVKAVQFQIVTSALRGVLGKGRDILFLGCIVKTLVNLNSITIGIRETRPGPLSQSALYWAYNARYPNVTVGVCAASYLV